MSGDGKLNQQEENKTSLRSSKIGQDIGNSALENDGMPNREASSLEVNNGVTKTVNLDGSVTYEGYGIKGAVKEIELKNGVKGIEHSWTMLDMPQYQELSSKVEELFKEQYPNKKSYLIIVNIANLKSGTIITILDDSGKAVSGKDYKEHEELGKEHKLEIAPTELRAGLEMLHLLKRAFYEFKKSDGSPLEYNNSFNGNEIGSIDDPATLGNYGLRFKGEPGSRWSPGLYVDCYEIYGSGFPVSHADAAWSAAFVRPVPESKS